MTSRRVLAAVLVVCGGLAWLASPVARLLLAFPLIVYAPGILIEAALDPQAASRPLLTRMALWPALSVALITLLYLWAAVLGVRIPAWAIGALAAGCTAGTVALLTRAPQHPARSSPAVLAATGLVAALIAQTRFAHIAGLALPPWVDSVHHALLIRVASEQGHAPLALAPFLPVNQLGYHSGYHSLSAAMLAVAGAPVPAAIPQAMLIHGQLLSVAVALACAGLAQALWRHWAAALATLIVVGLVSIMPAYYVSWGRYTLLTGMLMLPAALILLRRVARRRSWRAILAAALVLAGLSLVHFVIFVFALAWCMALICTQAWPGRRSLALACARLALAGLLTAAATAPWIALLAAHVRPGSGASAMHLAGNSDYNAMPYALLWTSTNKLLAGLAGCGALLGLMHRRTVTVLVAAWSLVVVLLSNLPLIGLPYISFLTNEIVAVTMFLPVALLIGVGAAVLARRAGLEARPRAAGRRQLLALAGFLVLSAWGAWQLQHVIRADTILASSDDVEAIAWAGTSTSPDARFVVNTVGWLGDVDRGADGGWWLLPLAGRAVSTPPVVYTYGPDDYVERVKQETAWLRSAGQVSDVDLAAWMRAHGYQYVYATRSGTTLNRERLSASPLFEQAYANQSVAIFVLRP